MKHERDVDETKRRTAWQHQQRGHTAGVVLGSEHVQILAEMRMFYFQALHYFNKGRDISRRDTSEAYLI